MSATPTSSFPHSAATRTLNEVAHSKLPVVLATAVTSLAIPTATQTGPGPAGTGSPAGPAPRCPTQVSSIQLAVELMLKAGWQGVTHWVLGSRSSGLSTSTGLAILLISQWMCRSPTARTSLSTGFLKLNQLVILCTIATVGSRLTPNLNLMVHQIRESDFLEGKPIP